MKVGRDAMRTIATGLIVVTMLAGVAAGAPRAATTKAGATDPLIEEAASAVEAGRLSTLATSVENLASDALAKPETADLARLVQLATLRECGRWFGRIEHPSAEQKATLAWLLRQKRLAATLMMSVTNSDPPDRALSILTALHKDQHDRLERFADLTTAACLVWDDPERFGTEDDPMDLPRVVGIFKDYAENPAATHDVARDLPVNLLIFVVDRAISEDEVQWVRRQSTPPGVGSAFFEVGYGPTRELKRDAKADEPQNAYTLPNLRKVGGRLADQAYYAAQVGKAVGIPTAICTGPEREGEERETWVAFSDPRGQWDLSSARYRVHWSSPGEAIDPQTMESFPQAELSLTAGLRATPSAKRLAATALCKLLDRVLPEQQLAALKRAVELSPSDRRVWRRVADWAQQHRPGSDEYRNVVSLVSAHLTPRSEDAAMYVRLRMLAKVAADDRARSLADLLPAFEGRPDLAATIQLARASALLEKKDGDGALSALAEVIPAADVVPAHAASAMRMADDILRERSDLDRLAGVYARVWPRMRPPTQSPVAHTTAYWFIGQEYAQLLEELGRKNDVENIREKLGQLLAEPVKR
jgi:hypothetical protein